MIGKIITYAKKKNFSVGIARDKSLYAYTLQMHSKCLDETFNLTYANIPYLFYSAN